MTPAALTSVLELLEHIDRLKALHRANESPSFGEVELLFDRAEDVRHSLAAPRRQSGKPWPTRSLAIEKAARQLVELLAEQITQKGSAA